MGPYLAFDENIDYNKNDGCGRQRTLPRQPSLQKMGEDHDDVNINRVGGITQRGGANQRHDVCGPSQGDCGVLWANERHNVCGLSQEDHGVPFVVNQVKSLSRRHHIGILLCNTVQC